MNKDKIIEALDAEKVELQKRHELQINALDVAISVIKNSINSYNYTNQKPNVVQDDLQSNKAKVVQLLSEKGRFLHMTEIIEIALSKEPDADKEKLTKQIQQTIYKLKNEGVIINHQVGLSNLNVFWGSKNWIGEDGIILPERKYNEEKVKGFKKESYVLL